MKHIPRTPKGGPFFINILIKGNLELK